MNPQNTTAPLSQYQKIVIFILAITQFTVVLDFMVMSPLGDIMMKTLQITTAQFGIAVSAYAFSAGIAGLLTAGFADRYDRKKLLLFFYIGFIIGTILCGLANSYFFLLAARIITGLFGGVISSISMAIIADIFTLSQRGKAIGIIQMGFGTSQVLGIPIGLYIANLWTWNIPFYAIAIVAIIVVILIKTKLKPINQHLSIQQKHNAINHLWSTLKSKNYRIGFVTTALLSVGGFMMMPFGSAFAINNLKVTETQLPLLFMITGIATLITMPIIGKISDTFSKYRIFAFSSAIAIIIINIYANFNETSFYIVVLVNVVMMMAIMSRIVPSSALASAIPSAHDRGAFMSINSSLQQIAGGFGAVISGAIIHQKNNYAPLENYNTMALIASLIMLLTIFLMKKVETYIFSKEIKIH